MRRFYQAYQIQQTVSVKLTWSHYCELLSISDADKRSFYEKEAINAGWSVRELRRQIESSLFERLLLSKGDANKEQVLALAPADIIRDPYVFEFLGLPEDKPVMESDLERALVQQIEKFLLELGRGFMFVGTQQRVTLNNTHYYVDMVFYNKILRAYVLIELKTTKLTPEAAGQINMYLNYYAAEVNDADDNPPIGIILCTEKDSVAAEYALGGLSNNIFASRYVLYMPDKEQLIAEKAGKEIVTKDGHGMKLGKIKEVDIRKVWPHEQYDFSKWLAAEENIMELGDTLNLTRTDVETEKFVGSYRCDIICKDELTGKSVLIENQLEQTNHDHLGKIITYASGLDASVVVWIVAEAREEHASAIEWMNKHTDDDLAFF